MVISINRKLIAAALVPILLVTSGALAFSAFSGTINTNVTAAAGTMAFNQDVISVVGNDNNTNFSIAGIPSMAYVPLETGIPVGWAGEVTTGQSVYTLSQTINASGLAPGDWFYLAITVTNNGTVGFKVGTPTASADQTLPGIGTFGNVTINPLVSAFSLSPQQFNTSLQGMSGYVVQLVNQTTFGVSLDQGGYTLFYVAVGLGGMSGNAWQESSMHLSLTYSVTSDP